MTRLELIVRQLGTEPKVVPLTQTLVVGRSRRADVTIDDEEVGREQFRIGLENGKVFIEGIGTTNQTLVDGSVLASGAKRTLPPGSTIRVGRTTFSVQSDQGTEGARPGAEMPDMTMVAPRPTGPQVVGDSTDAPLQDRTGGVVSPMRTMPGVRPGAPGPGDAGPGARSGSPPPSSGRPGQPPTAEDRPDQDDAAPEQTMQLKGGPGYRPGQPAPRPAEPAPPQKTMPAPRAAPMQKPPAPPANPAAPPPTPKASPTPKATGPSADNLVRPTTVAVQPVDLAAEIGKAKVLDTQAVDIEARLHESLPRLLVKCEGLKRRIRLLKARNMLGRAEATDVLLPNESVSEQHAEIMFDGTKWMLRDRGSTNGSFVDGGELRGTSRELLCHSIIGLGIVRAIFLCNDRRNRGGQLRLEERAVKLLVQAGRLQAEAGREALRVAHADKSQSIAELLLMDTQLSPAEWATAITTARGQRTFMDSVRQALARLRPNRRAPKTP